MREEEDLSRYEEEQACSLREMMEDDPPQGLPLVSEPLVSEPLVSEPRTPGFRTPGFRTPGFLEHGERR
ncbi:hypothetical protein NHX12_010811 [Muraenolepis orangiensis]|uniref:Uncharacterized protein n=1 Tax=Muraenolepis orangiensis TaxID=630683 RepID=A0A9Q0DEX9_9TELE|nr:hypothetical protein NHX12_010811 [Muraenolepis orangiensis]